MTPLELKLKHAMFELGDMYTHRADVDAAIASKMQEIAQLRNAIVMQRSEAAPSRQTTTEGSTDDE